MSAVIGRQKHCVHEMLVQDARVDMADFRGLTVYHYAVKYLPEVLDVSVTNSKTMETNCCNCIKFKSRLDFLYAHCQWDLLWEYPWLMGWRIDGRLYALQND